MTNATYFVGFDIANAQFHGAMGTRPWKLQVPGQEFANTPDGFAEVLAWLQQHDCTVANSVLCMEATGVYGEALAYFLVAQGYQLAIEPPLKVKRAFKVSGPKTDPVDSEQIAEYACRYEDELVLWQPPQALIEHLQVLLATREQLIQQSTAHQNALKALRRKHVRTPFAETVYEHLLTDLRAQIKAVEQEIRRLIDEHPTAHRLLLLLLTIPGVGLLLATHIVVLTQCATQCWPYPKLAAHLGICPYRRESGSSVRARPTSRHYGPSQPRKLLHLAARSVTTHNAHFRTYYERKLAEGKSKPLALNNVANKLLRIICAILESHTAYAAGYRSAKTLPADN
jgi:transposase